MQRLLAAFFLVLLTSTAFTETFRNPRRIPLSVDPVSVVTGDINGDGRPDILYGTGQYSGGVLHPLLAQSDGSYLPGTDIVLPSAISPRCILASVTGGTAPDLICVAFGSTTPLIDVFPGRGDGTFGTAISTALTTTADYSALTVAATGDINKDGHLDLIVTDGEIRSSHPCSAMARVDSS